jgi:hypothetical protein
LPGGLILTNPQQLIKQENLGNDGTFSVDFVYRNKNNAREMIQG